MSFEKQLCPPKNYQWYVLGGMFSGYGVRGTVTFVFNEINPIANPRILGL